MGWILPALVWQFAAKMVSRSQGLPFSSKARTTGCIGSQWKTYWRFFGIHDKNQSPGNAVFSSLAWQDIKNLVECVEKLQAELTQLKK